MLRGLFKLTWLEIKIFLREPLGAFGSIFFPVLVFVVVGRMLGGRLTAGSASITGFVRVGLPVLAAVLIPLSGVLSLVTIISIYREGGILRRLRATPLRPHTILTAHVLVKLALTVVTMVLMVLAGKRYYPVNVAVPIFGFAAALLISTCSILSIGFIIASIVPTARFAQPIGAAILYPMLALCGLFVPLDSLPPALHAAAACLAADLRRVAPSGNLEGRAVVGAPWRCSGAGGRIHHLHGTLGKGFPLGIMRTMSEIVDFSYDTPGTQPPVHAAFGSWSIRHPAKS